MENFSVGSVVEVHGMKGTVRFIGSTQFATGRWVGIELENANGKNDGSVQGVRYFECKENFGVFVRASQVKNVLSNPTPTAASMASMATPQEPSSPSSASVTSSRRESIMPSGRESMISRRESTAVGLHNQPISVSTGGKTVPFKDYEELRLRLKLLESKRVEDRERIADFERIKAEHEQLEVAKKRLLEKTQELQMEMISLKKSIKEANAKREEVEAKYQEVIESLEMITLDKEVAEEKAETLELEMEILKEKVEEMQLNAQVQESMQNTGAKEATLEEAQLLKQNERLKEALVKLRDVTTARETELERSNKDMEKELTHLKASKARFEEVKVKLANAEDQIDHLKMQLDDALDNSEMIEILTVKNLKLSEQVEQQKEAILDLEAMKELNEELEENHVETEKQLQAIIDFKEVRIRELFDEIENLSANNADYENTIMQFRDLVRKLQQDLDRLNEKHGEVKSDALASQTEEMQKLNIQLQNSVMKNTAKTIELELRRMEALEAKFHLDLVSSYLPKEYHSSDEFSVKTLLSMKRLLFKSDLISRFLEGSNANRLDLAMRMIRQISVYLVFLLQKVFKFYSKCDQDQFLALSGLLGDLELAENKIDSVIEALKRESLDSSHLVSIQRLISQVESIVEAKKSAISVSVSTVDDLLGSHLVRCCDLMLETSEFIINEMDNSFKVELDRNDDFVALLSEARPSLLDLLVKLRMLLKNIGKRLSELNDSNALKYSVFAKFEEQSHDIQKILLFFCELFQRIVLSSSEQVDCDHIVSTLNSSLGFQNGGSNLFMPIKVFCSSLLESQNSIYEMFINPSFVVLAPSNVNSPWMIRASQLQNQIQSNSETERELSECKDKIEELKLEVKTKEENYNQAFVKVQFLQKKIDDLRQQSSVVDHYEAEIIKLKDQEKNFIEAMETLQVEIEKLERELSEERSKEKSVGLLFGQVETSGISDKKVSSLYALLMRLKDENKRLRFIHATRNCQQLFSDPFDPLKTVSTRHQSTSLQTQLVQEYKSIKNDLCLAAASSMVVDLTRMKPPGSNKWSPKANEPLVQLQMQESLINTLKKRCQKLECGLNSMVIETSKQPKPPVSKDRRLFGKVCVKKSANVHDRYKLLLNPFEFEKLHSVIINNLAS